MNFDTSILVRYVIDGDIRKAQKQARIVLEKLNTKRDEQFKKEMLGKLDAKGSTLIELPHNLRELLVAEDVSNFPIGRFILRPDEEDIVNKVLAIRTVAEELQKRGIPYLPTLMLHGVSGGGKTMLARYIAYKAEVPFVYVRFSGLVGSYLGQTQGNVGKVFEYARTTPCVLSLMKSTLSAWRAGRKTTLAN